MIAAYDGLLTDLVIDRSDSDEAITLRHAGLSIHVADTRIGDASAPSGSPDGCGVGGVTGPVTLLPVTGIPQAKPGDDVVELILIGSGTAVEARGP